MHRIPIEAILSSKIRILLLAIYTVAVIGGLFAPTSREAAPASLSKCGSLISPGRKYVLQQDVSSPGTCFSIQADGIILDLHGHTVTYGTSRGPSPSFGILGTECWDPDFGKNPCGGSFNNFTVFGGTITQGEEAAPFSHGIRLGQGPGNGLIAHDLTFHIHAESSIPIYTTFLGTHSMIFNNVFDNSVTTIRNRHQQQGQSIKIADGKPPGPALIYGNHITGGAQGGIFSVTKGSKIHDNVVSQKGTYTNDFGIYAWSDGGEVFNNTVTPILGRGISIAGGVIGSKVYGNNVKSIEQKDNVEYGGCQMGGTFGIQFDDLPQKTTAFRNTVEADADQCDAQALRVTDSREGSENSSHDNTYTARRLGNSGAVATGFGSGGATGFLSERDVFVGDTSAVAFDWDGGQNLIFRECKFVKGANSIPNFVTFAFKNGKTNPVSNIQFIDSVFEGGAEKTSMDMKPIASNGDWPGPSEYFIDWTFSLLVQDQNKRALANANVSIQDARGQTAYVGKTNAEGSVSVVLTELRIYNTLATVLRERRTPYRVRVAKPGCMAETPSFSVELDRKTLRDAVLQCSPDR
jgi:hypothetical protein